MALYDRIMDGIRMAEAGRAAGRRSKLESLLGDAYSNPQGRQQAFAEAAKIDAPTTIAMQQKLADIDQEGLARAAQMLVAAPEDLRPQIYKSQVYQYGQGMGVPQEYTPFMLPMMEKLAQRWMQNGIPAQVQAFNAMASGLSPEERARAQRINLGLDPRASSAAITYREVTMPDGRKTLVALDPREVGAQMLGTGQTYGSGVGGGTLPQGQAQQYVDQTTELASQMARAGIPDAQIEQFIQTRLNAGGISTQPPTQEQPAAADLGPRLDPVRGGYATGGNPFIGPSEAETAASKRLAETNIDMATADARARAEAQIAGQREAAVQAARVEAERAEQAPVRREAFRQMVAKTDAVGGAIDRALSQVDWSTSGPIGSFMSNLPGSDAYDLRATIDTIKANLAFDTLQQMRAASPTGGALGAVSERELRLLESAVASLDQAQSGAQLRQAMQTIKQHYQEWRRSAEAAFQQTQSGRQGSSQQPSGWGIQRVD